MSIKVHYLYSHTDRFPEISGDPNEESEIFHGDIKTMEDVYQGKWVTHMMADYAGIEGTVPKYIQEYSGKKAFEVFTH